MELLVRRGLRPGILGKMMIFRPWNCHRVLEEADVGAVSRQVELALFYGRKLDFAAI